MAVAYRIFRNAVDGGPIDLSAPFATTAGLTWDSPSLVAPSDNRFLVRAYDTTSGLTERNVDAQVHITVDATGSDISARPNAPLNLSARPTANGGARVAWAYATQGQGGPPTGFHVYLSAGPAVDFSASPAATIPYFAGLTSFTADLTGLADEATYSISVRAFNATATEANTIRVTIEGEVVGPAAVDDLAAVATA